MTQLDFLDSIPEARYLTAERYTYYRFILRFFYLEYQKMNYQLDKDAILAEARSRARFAWYTQEQLLRDLEQLTEWKSLTAIQDPRKVNTIVEFKNRRYLYMMTRTAVEIERMTVRLEELSTQVSGLSAHAFRRIRDDLSQIERLDTLSLTEVHDWWEDLKAEFNRMSGQYQDYLWRFYDSGEYRNPAEFASYKQELIRYLEEFIRELQHSTDQIGAQLEAVSPEAEARLLDLVYQSELAIPRPESERTGAWREEVRRQIAGIWNSVKSWFLGEGATAGQVLEITNEVISKAAQSAQLLVQMGNMDSGGKAELRHLMGLFAASGSLEEAHRLSALVFGVPRSRHFTVNAQSPEPRTGSSVWEDGASETVLQPRTRTYRERSRETGFTDKSAEKAAQRRRLLAEERSLRRKLDACIQDGKLDFRALDGELSPELLLIFLNWIHHAARDPDGRGYTQYGQLYTLRMREGPACTVRCTEGELTMPDCVLIFDGSGPNNTGDSESDNAGSDGADRRREAGR